MIKEMGVNLNTVSRSATLIGFKPKKSNTEKGENRKQKTENLNISLMKTRRLNTVQ
ncbi:hypothetical protein [Photorhabdus akhurstii]|uniref:hypothetical protein n=1 Tax=Photorhabdus akhurstii TaxID=171438 RepID=UPI001BD20E84|nr:hypothetical protein [Photorhabdus akhurstii]